MNYSCVVKELGHEVVILTSHHDPSHCFDETKPAGYHTGDILAFEFTYVAGKLGKNIIVAGDNLPRQIFGMFTALCSIVRMIYLSYVVSLLVKEYKIDLVVLDGISAPIPLLQVS